MTPKLLEEILRKKGFWRCQIIETSSTDENPKLEIYIPKTSKNKFNQFVKNYIPASLNIDIREMKNPLKYKKHTYIFTKK